MNLEQSIQQYTHAAWYFTCSNLWPNNSFSDDEVRKALADLEHYFRIAPDLAEALKTLCGRVMIAAANKKKCPILHPALWLNPINTEGLTSPKFNGLKAMLRRVPAFNNIAAIIAEAYFSYINEPSLDTLLKCSGDLEGIGQKTWMGVFYDAIQHQPSV